MGEFSPCLAISGGVGGAKLALGLSKLLTPESLTIVANTGDDFTHLGLAISPDLDTVMYTLADLSNKQLGWGQTGETWNFLETFKTLGGEAWFQLGDKDLATHVLRSQLLARGESLSQVTAHLCGQLAISHPLLPMTDDPVATIVHTRGGEELSFQHYFVRDRCQPEVSGFHFSGIELAKPAQGFISAVQNPDLGSIIICPSNPFVSVDPVMLLPGVLQEISAAKVPLVAVSPIVGGMAIKGPAAKMMKELGMPQTALAVAEHYVSQYQGCLRGFVLDQQDAHLETQIAELGVATLVTNSVMQTLEDRINLAREVLLFAEELVS